MKKRYWFLIVFVLIFLFLVVVGQNSPQKQLEKAMQEEISYTMFSENSFSVLYPEWPEQDQESVELTGDAKEQLVMSLRHTMMQSYNPPLANRSMVQQ